MSLIFEMDEKGNLSIDIYHLLHELPEYRHIELAESLSCSDVVIRHVMDQVLSGCTEGGFSGSWSTDGTAPLQVYKREIAKNANKIAKMEIEGLEQSLISEKEQTKKYSDLYFNLYHKREASY